MGEIRLYHPLDGVQSAQLLDVSNYQGHLDWSAAAKAGICGGIYRVTQGLGGTGTNSPDPDDFYNHDAIRDAGLHRGAYHFLDPELDGAAQARYMVDTLAGLGLVDTDMLFCDNETLGSGGYPQAAACARAFMAELATLRPHNPHGVYTFINFARDGGCAGLGGYALWLAYPSATAPTPPPPWVEWDFWQWGLRNGDDADAFNGTVAQLDAWIASFQAAAAGPPYTHLTRRHDTIGSLSASRNESAPEWLAEQEKLGGDVPGLTSGKLRAGIRWKSVQ
jgi:lysozyme